MISSIFGKTKPINYIILLAFLFIFYCTVHFLVYKLSFTIEQLLLQSVVLGILLFSIFVVNFVVKRNQITGTNSFTALFYVLLIVVFHAVVLDNNAILCSFFLLLAHRRLISLKSLKEVKLKLLDASLWVALASIFYDWALIYFILIFAAIYFYEPKNIRNWLIPFLGVFTLGIILFGFLTVVDQQQFISDHYRFEFSLDINFFAYWGNSTKMVIYAIFVLIIGLWAFFKLGKLGMGKIMTMRLIAISFAIGMGLTLLKTSESSFPVLITFFPAAVLFTKYIEVIKKVNIKEIALMISVLVPFVIFLAEWIVK
ncbi:hypothetical protein [Muriicola sp. Z0-33]|uniref:hypothetical protein n=1 Tax=Muriicola sp. Z0-33 TaxID=2816957 RepID=UPI002237E8E2|nr:hypothetical protein [Muriicola sp. Z0-33]MCW5514635.1 hypothetical protein [Muriicola sp. Z0-33]